MLILNSQEISLKKVTDGALEKEVVDMQEVRGSNPCTSVFSVRNPVNAVKKKFSPLKTAKIHRIQR